MAGVRADISVAIDATLTGTADLGTPKQRVLKEKLLQFVPGTAAIDQANILFSDTRTLAASTSEDLDLAGVLSSVFGATITAAEILAIYVEAAAGNSNNVNLTRPASNGVPLFLAAGDGVAVKPGQMFLLVDQAGIAVTAGTGDLITLTNSSSGSSVSYDIVIIARTVAA